LHALVAHQVRTTAAVTVLQAGTAANVLPQTATVGLNFRLLPGHSVETVEQLVKGWLGR
jgi:carboxypeptidase PM20D1